MNTQTFYFEPQPLSLGGKVLAAVTAAVLLVGGLFFSLLLLAVGTAVVGVTLLRLWWAGRKLQQVAQPAASSPAGTHGQRVLEGEYTVRSERGHG